MKYVRAKSVPLENVLNAEHDEISVIRQRRAAPAPSFDRGHDRKPVDGLGMPNPADEPNWPAEDQPWVDAVRKAHSLNLVGLAFSGGGIRSATFNLGVLQALADLNLLKRIDYLSTVSGGGYIGGWLAAWTKRAKSFALVQNALATNRVHQEGDREPSPIRFLRMFSNYLTPKLGIFSGDTWATIGIYLRNMLLNQVVLLALLTALLLLPRAAERFARAIWFSPILGETWMLVATVLLLLAFFTILNNMEYLDLRDAGAARQLTKQIWVLSLAAAPLFITAALGALWEVARLAHLGPTGGGNLPYGEAACTGAIAYGAIWFAASILGLIYRAWFAPIISKIANQIADLQGETTKPPEKESPGGAADTAHTAAPGPGFMGIARNVWKFAIIWLGAILAGALVGWLYAVLSQSMLSWSIAAALTAGVPLVLGIFLLAGILHIGWMGTVFPDRGREWWGRLGGWLLLWGLVWLAIFWIALYFPDFIQTNQTVKAAAAKYLTPTWIAATLGGVLAGNSTASGKPGTQTWKDVLAKVAPYVFVVGLLCWISWTIARIREWNLLANMGWISDHRLYLTIAACLLVSVIMAWRVDVNQFSMHLFYRNRLVRCYLGASNPTRSPNRFTGFDKKDDIHLKDFSVLLDNFYDGPYPVINASLNLVKGKDLAWQERKAESFVMTPRYCGYDVWLEEQDSPMLRGERPLTKQDIEDRDRTEDQSILRRWLRKLDRFGYCQTDQYAFPPPFFGPDLGLAMGISGAAASPNMGSYSSIPVAFLMTIFNVRLGQWLGNPRHRRTSGSATPGLGLPYLVNELLAGTDDESRYVYLSDGGHFENLAMYELVKRRCALIIVCDAEADDTYCFGGLGNAIRKCRIDLGIDIELDVSEIKPKKDGKPSKKHFAVGKIHYENVDLEAPTGTIIYFKASLTGDEPADVNNYAKTHATFPHESTVDQWFTETQFESYRLLGYHEVISSIPNGIRPQGPDAGARGPDAGVPEDASPDSPKRQLFAALQSVTKLASAAMSTVRAGAAAVVAGIPAAKGDQATPEVKPDAKPDSKPSGIQWRTTLGDLGFDVSNLKEAPK
ncbi:MAG: patatin-like phospholipase family protein [Candidatus Acidiferrales bacterium]